MHDVTPKQRPAMETALVNKAVMRSGVVLPRNAMNWRSKPPKEFVMSENREKPLRTVCSSSSDTTQGTRQTRETFFSKDVPVSIVHWMCGVHQHAL